MGSEVSAPSLDAVSRGFKRFAELECRNVSPFYEGLSLRIAEDPEVLTLARDARQGQPRPNLFFAAVHFLLLNGMESPLASFYPTISGTASRTFGEGAYRHFRTFCLEHRGEIREIISRRIVQTNVVRRCGCLLPAFTLVGQEAAGRPLALIEIGASAGLLLNWDHYGYDYGAGVRSGDANSPVQIACALRGDNHPPIPTTLPQVVFRLGIDLNPLDVRNPEDALWLRALVWPDEVGRDTLQQQAIQIAQKAPPPLIGGDALDILPSVFRTLPVNAIPCIFHTATVNQFTQEARQHLTSLLDRLAAERPLSRVFIEWERGRPGPQLGLVTYQKGRIRDKILGNCDTHGSWLEWLYKE